MISFDKKVLGITAHVTAELTGSGHSVILAIKHLDAGIPLAGLLRPKVNKTIIADWPVQDKYPIRLNDDANLEITIPGNIISLTTDLAFEL